MDIPYNSLLDTEFIPLSEVKAKLSEQIRKTPQKRIVITQNGKPSTVLLAYEDYLSLLRQLPQNSVQAREIDYLDWKKSSDRRQAVSLSISNLFDSSKLKRKGQKSYKQRIVHAFNKPTKN